MESLDKKGATGVRDERDEQSQDNKQEVSGVSDERKVVSQQTDPPLSCKHDLRFPGQGEPIPDHGLPGWWRPSLPFGQ